MKQKEKERIASLQINNLPIADLKEYANNPRHNDAAVDAVAASIKEFGFKVPIIIDRDNVIVAGHTRLKAARKLGLETVPCIIADDLTPEQINAFRLADNKTAELADWDFELLEKELAALADFDMEQFGFDISAPEDLQEVEEDEVPDIDENTEPVTQLGDIWQLGEHRLLCGDSTDKESTERLMAGAKANLAITDPPYNVALGMNGSPDEARQRHRRTDGLVIMNDKQSDEDFLKFLTSAYMRMDENLVAGGAFYIWHADTQGFAFRLAAKNMGWQIRQNLIWVKNQMTLGHRDYQWQHEPCLYGWKDGAGHYFSDSRTETTVIEDKPNINKMSKAELKAYVKELLKNEPASTIIREDKPLRSEQHPTMKPVKLIAYLIRNSSRKGEIVLDVFGGSGTTLIACEQLGRRCYMEELDPKYCDVIIKRWEALTGQKAVRIEPK